MVMAPRYRERNVIGLKIGRLSRWEPGSPEIAHLRADLAALRTVDAVEQALAEGPVLSDADRDRLIAAVRGASR